jgi:NAD(P)-dependent dehydrogenase (short-subunit alcohol dehydrogenase family)
MDYDPMEDSSELDGKTVLVVGASAGMGLATARLARSEGAELILTARDAGRLDEAVRELEPVGSATFDAHDPAQVKSFFDGLEGHVDHVMVTAGRPRYGDILEMDFETAREAMTEHALMVLEIARNAAPKIHPGGTLLFLAGTGMRAISPEWGAMTAATGALSKLIPTLSVQIAPVRINLIAAGFVDTPMSAELLGENLDARRQELTETLPIRRVVQAEDVARLAVHLMVNTAITGGTYDIDGGQQFL